MVCRGCSKEISHASEAGEQSTPKIVVIILVCEVKGEEIMAKERVGCNGAFDEEQQPSVFTWCS